MSADDDIRRMLDEICSHNDQAALLDGHDNAIIGMVRQHGSPCLVLYDPVKVIDNLMVNDGMSYDEAVEFYQYNIECAYTGKNTPAMLVRLESTGAENEGNMEEDKP
jgi:hypothetical protein